jgi:hypothetical protein
MDVARAIIEISYAQYQPNDEKPKARYRIDDEAEESDEECGSELDMNGSQDIPVLREIVDDRFTLENIGEISTQVKSKVSPLELIMFHVSCWDYLTLYDGKKPIYGLDAREIERNGREDLVTWSVITGDNDLLSFALDLIIEWTDRITNKEDGSSAGIPTINDNIFKLALEYGRLDILAELINHTGAGIALESLVKKSGVQYVEKPKYYQGLSVHGKKRADWVSAARGTRVQVATDTSPPLLLAAYYGNIASVEWFLSDAPSRHYKDFAEAYKHHKFIQHLNKPAVGGFDKILGKCLNARRHLALHCAVMAAPRPESGRLIEYLLNAMPETLEMKCNSGLTPLALAFSLTRFEAAKILLNAGADQTARDNTGANILHLMLCSAYTAKCVEAKHLQKFLDLIDKRLHASLLTERSSHEPGSLTPLSRWMRKDSEDEELMRMLLEFGKETGNEQLEVLDGSGDTPLHYAVKCQKQNWLKIMLEYRPDLLYRENSVGRTPYELAEDAYIASCVSNAPHMATGHSYNSLILQKPTESFAPAYVPHERIDTESVWRLCESFLKTDPKKRRLVSLLDANEVANRLAKRQKSLETNVHGRGYNSEAASVVDEETEGSDEVAQWYLSAEYL